MTGREIRQLRKMMKKRTPKPRNGHKVTAGYCATFCWLVLFFCVWNENYPSTTNDKTTCIQQNNSLISSWFCPQVLAFDSVAEREKWFHFFPFLVDIENQQTAKGYGAHRPEDIENQQTNNNNIII